MSDFLSEPKIWQGVLGAAHGPQKIPRDLRSDSTCFFGLSSMEHVGLAKQLGYLFAKIGMFSFQFFFPNSGSNDPAKKRERMVLEGAVCLTEFNEF